MVKLAFASGEDLCIHKAILERHGRFASKILESGEAESETMFSIPYGCSKAGAQMIHWMYYGKLGYSVSQLKHLAPDKVQDITTILISTYNMAIWARIDSLADAIVNTFRQIYKFSHPRWCEIKALTEEWGQYDELRMLMLEKAANTICKMGLDRYIEEMGNRSLRYELLNDPAGTFDLLRCVLDVVQLENGTTLRSDSSHVYG